MGLGRTQMELETLHREGKEMKRIETVTHSYDQVSGITCDMCGAHTGSSDWPDPSDSFLGADNIAETTILYKTGWSWPGEGGSGIQVDVDLCPGCFRDKLIPWLKSQGVQIKMGKWEE